MASYVVNSLQVLLGVDPDELPIVGGGDGSIEEMKQCLACCTRDALFGLLRLSFSSGCFRQTKFVSLQVRLRGESEGFLCSSHQPSLCISLDDGRNVAFQSR